MVARVRPSDNVTYVTMDEIMDADIDGFIDAVVGRERETQALVEGHNGGHEGVDTDDDDPQSNTKRGRGRPKGSRNKTSIALKEALIVAAQLEGFDHKGKDGLVGFLRKLSRTQPKTFGALLGRVVPLHIVGSVDHQHRVMRSKEEVVKELEDRGLPVSMVYDGALDAWTPEDDEEDD